MLNAIDLPPDGLFWSEPFAIDSEFSAEDPLAFDYLGQQVGLWLFRGFTTRTSRAQNYAVVLYGLHLAEKAVRRFGYPADDETRIKLFERWERFWALATLEFRKGLLERGDEDAMRGVRKASLVWSQSRGFSRLPLDFTLISRQSELGGLGAYLTSLREYGLVFPGSLRVTPAAQDILAYFWSEQGERDWSHLYEEYALDALNSETSHIVRKKGHLTLANIGKRSRLSALVHCRRTKQQERLWNILFVGARDGSTLPLAEKLILAHEDGVNSAEAILEGLLFRRWGELSVDNRNKVEAALAFGRLARLLLSRFNRAYGYVNEQGWVAKLADVAEVSFPRKWAKELHNACREVLTTHVALSFQKLPHHGPELITLLTKLVSSDPTDSLRHFLMFHRSVQRARRGGGSWLREEQDRLVMQLAAYSGYKADARFPEMKLNVVRQLLADLGRLK